MELNVSLWELPGNNMCKQSIVIIGGRIVKKIANLRDLRTNHEGSDEPVCSLSVVSLCHLQTQSIDVDGGAV